jgi:predicted  nucleic acid-binding Zn-ribbon protein
MSDGELDKKIEFIIDQQAQFTADIAVMREVHAADTKLLTQQYRNLSDAVTTIVGLVGKLTDAQEGTEGRVGELRARSDERFAAMAQAQTRSDEKLAELAERLNIFISVVEKHISGNGNKGPADHA